MRTVPLYGNKAAGRVALVDDEDYDLVMQYRWNVHECNRSSPCGPYAVTHGPRSPGNRPTIRMHNLIIGFSFVDHINHDGLDNRRENLRSASNQDNNRNRRKVMRGHSQFKGVTRAHKTRWTARIRVNGRSVWLGYFRSEVDAALAYDAAARKYFGEFAYPNFPD